MSFNLDCTECEHDRMKTEVVLYKIVDVKNHSWPGEHTLVDVSSSQGFSAGVLKMA